MKRFPLFRLSLGVFIVWLGIRWANTQFTIANVEGSGHLANCPESPNCVSTRTSNPDQQFSPIQLDRPVALVLRDIAAIIRKMPRSRIVTLTNRYIHAEFKSLLFGFADDVEVVLDETQGVIHLRSASRIGYSDLGVNRHRIEAIRKQYDSRVEKK